MVSLLQKKNDAQVNNKLVHKYGIWHEDILFVWIIFTLKEKLSSDEINYLYCLFNSAHINFRQSNTSTTCITIYCRL